MVSTGLQVHQALETQPREPDETQLTTVVLQHAGQGTVTTHKWERGWLCVGLSDKQTEMHQLQRLQEHRYGVLHVAALLAAPATGEDILIGADGLPIRPRDFAGLLTKHGSIGDLLTVRWRPDGQLEFQCQARPYPLQDAQARAFQTFCDILLFNYPGLLRNPGPLQDLVPTSSSLDVWQLEKSHGEHELWWSPVNGIRVSAGMVSSTKQAMRAARHLTGDPVLRFHPHIWLDNAKSLWHQTKVASATSARALLQVTMRTNSEDDITRRRERWKLWNPRIADALDDIDWDEILRIPGTPATQRLLLFRIRGGRITGWSRAHNAVVCPHCPDLGSAGGRVDHIFWDCSQAQRLWDELRNRWAQLWTPSTRPSKHAFLRSVFSLRLNTVPSKIWDHPEITRLPQPTVQDTSATHQAIHAAWRTQVLATLHTIWRWRSEPDTPETLWTPAQARAYHDGCMRATLTDLRWRRTQDSAASCHTAAAIEIIRSWDLDREVEPAPGADASVPIYVMFFDGGSRGNPEPGGSGTAIIRTDYPSRMLRCC